MSHREVAIECGCQVFMKTLIGGREQRGELCFKVLKKYIHLFPREKDFRGLVKLYVT